jgi:putative ABC transport system permease protein
VESIGSNTYFISRFPAGQPALDRLPEHIRRRRYFDPDTAQRLQEYSPHVTAATIFGNRGFFLGDPNDISYADRRVERVIVRGAELPYIDAIPLFAVERGRFFTQAEIDHAAPVVVLGQEIADQLFPTEEALGKTVRLNGKLLTVIGVFAHDTGFFGGPGVDQFAIIPFPLFRKHYPGAREYFIAFTIPSGPDGQTALDEVEAAMRRIRRLKPGEPNDFELFSPDFLTSLWNQLTGALVILTGIISSIGLLVGGLGVMNIMLISVVERTSEIGVRKAMGARQIDIRVQFLTEAVILTVTGGVLGVFVAGAISFLVRTFVPGVPATLSYAWIALGVAMAALVGLFFGSYPANRAARLDPIACLRYE